MSEKNVNCKYMQLFLQFFTLFICWPGKLFSQTISLNQMIRFYNIENDLIDITLSRNGWELAISEDEDEYQSMTQSYGPRNDLGEHTYAKAWFQIRGSGNKRFIKYTSSIKDFNKMREEVIKIGMKKNKI